MAARIILLDRTEEDGSGLAQYLARHGLMTAIWSGSEPSLMRLATAPPGLVLINRHLRLEPGLGLLRHLRSLCTVPIILRAVDADDEVDRVLALELGADDYLPASISPREALARIRSVLRRAPPAGTASGAAQPGWRLCLRSRELFAEDGSPRQLTSAEFDLLRVLHRQQGVPVQRDALSLAVLRRPYHPEDRALDNLVLRVRRKLGDTGPSARLIKSVRGIGYVFLGFDPAAQPAAQAGCAAELSNGHRMPAGTC
jgi:DNA-binding response OmpR family regulator